MEARTYVRNQQVAGSSPASSSKKASFVEQTKGAFLIALFRCAERDACFARDVHVVRDVRFAREAERIPSLRPQGSIKNIGDGSLCSFRLLVFLFPGGLQPSRVVFAGKSVDYAGNQGKSALHRQHTEPSPVFPGLKALQPDFSLAAAEKTGMDY